jgi:hypothetical protein
MRKAVAATASNTPITTVRSGEKFVSMLLVTESVLEAKSVGKKLGMAGEEPDEPGDDEDGKADADDQFYERHEIGDDGRAGGSHRRQEGTAIGESEESAEHIYQAPGVSSWPVF